MSFTKCRTIGMLIGLVGLLFVWVSGVQAAPLPPTVGPGAVGAINGQFGSIVSIPAGATLTPSPRGILLPVGTVVSISGQHTTLTQPTPFVLTSGGIRPTTMPGTGSSPTQFMGLLVLAALSLLFSGNWMLRRSFPHL